MREINYKYTNRGMYVTEDNTSFGEDPQLKIKVEPHDFLLTISGDVIRDTSLAGCSVIVSSDGEALFYDMDGNLIAKADKGESTYKRVRLEWKPEYLFVMFGCLVEVDNYPNCDGESDRWSTEWNTQRSVILKLNDNSVEVK